MTRTLEIRRHAKRDPDGDRLSPQGRIEAQDAGRALAARYDVVFVSPAQRAAETVAWMLRGAGRHVPDHAVVPGLVSDLEDRWRAAGKAAGSSRLTAIRERDPLLVEAESRRLADVLRQLVWRTPEGGRALAVGHSPLIEAALLGLTGREIEPLGGCEGVVITAAGQRYEVREIRLGGGP